MRYKIADDNHAVSVVGETILSKCPHCGMDTRTTSPSRIVATNERLQLGFKKDTLKLIFRILTLNNQLPSHSTTLKFLSRLKNYTDDEVKYGLSRFFEQELHLKGYTWQYAAGCVKRENEYRKAQKKVKQQPLPKEKL